MLLASKGNAFLEVHSPCVFYRRNLTGTDESGEEVYLEFVNSFLTKKLPIDLNDEEFKNNENYFDEIKDKLIASLK